MQICNFGRVIDVKDNDEMKVWREKLVTAAKGKQIITFLEFITAKRLELTGWSSFEDLWKEMNTKYKNGLDAMGKKYVSEFLNLETPDKERIINFFYKQKSVGLTSVQIRKQFSRRFKVRIINI